jgi:hypothetical protein
MTERGNGNRPMIGIVAIINPELSKKTIMFPVPLFDKREYAFGFSLRCDFLKKFLQTRFKSWS